MPSCLVVWSSRSPLAARARTNRQRPRPRHNRLVCDDSEAATVKYHHHHHHHRALASVETALHLCVACSCLRSVDQFSAAIKTLSGAI